MEVLIFLLFIYAITRLGFIENFSTHANADTRGFPSGKRLLAQPRFNTVRLTNVRGSLLNARH